MVIEIFKDPELLVRVRDELENMTTTPDERTTWMEELGNIPLMQSIYAEVLRLRTGVQTVFRDNRADIHINEWRFPKKSLIIVPTVEAHTDETYWNTRNGKHPLNRFWADRFLAYPGDPQSGPSREANPAREKNAAKSRSGPKFVNVGSSDAWIPYGVGERACPGRFFARRQMLAFCAIVVKNYDIKFLSLNPKAHVPSGDTFFGLGVLRPKNALPFRLRRV
jgi:cytochrome P450